ncbi:histone-lysine N-methyltransferase SETMAR [Plakobranchus ocellatus]|uniref:Histone-lysine N-methyltransferase SETMAR n=1 Tax=Plakobranchus ocellatus TaxID=259542 RepID=A0AAV3YPW9_9GAST|nr:histone-lysine N-methyltransferase SETMAR [Plakobranchus ocellatus]
MMMMMMMMMIVIMLFQIPLYFATRSRRGHTVSKGMGLLTLRMVTSWSPTPHSLIKLQNLPPEIGIKRVDYVKEEGVLHIYFDEFGKKAKRFSVDVVQDQDLRISRPKKADVRVVEYYETGVTTVQNYRIKTTCGSETKIPDEKKGNSATKATMQKASSASANTSSNCPECITTTEIPANFRSAVCNASAVYRGLAGRKGSHTLKLGQDLRPKKKLSKLSLFASYQLPPDCSCSLLSKIETSPKDHPLPQSPLPGSSRGELQHYGWEILPHPAHSPDLAPFDFHLFGPLKRHLGGMAFEIEDDLISELRNWFDNLDVDFFRVGINSLLSRWQKCIDLHGDYVEK